MTRKILINALLILPLSLLGCDKKTPIDPIDPNEGGEEIVFHPEPTPTGNFAIIMSRLKNPEDNHVMICAHRGLKNQFPENSLSGLKKCIELGIEAVEIDMAKTKDGKLILLHDETLDRTTTGSGKVSNYTLEEIRKLFLKDIDGKITNERVPTFEEVLDIAKGKILLQIDKWNGLTNDILPVLKEKQCLQQAIFRSTSSYEQTKATFKEYLDKVIYIPVIAADRAEAQTTLNGYLQNLPNMPVVSIVFAEPNNPMLNQVPELKQKYKIWFNAIQPSDCGKRGDALAITDPDGSYGWLVERGANIIFSSRGMKLYEYLKEKKLRQ